MMSSNLPLLVSINRSPGPSVPFWDPICGEMFDDTEPESWESTLDTFLEGIANNKYNCAKYIDETLGMYVATVRFVKAACTLIGGPTDGLEWITRPEKV